MPTSSATAKARKDKREGKAPSTQAGEFVREEIDEIRAGKHGARSTKQAIAIGLSKARRAGVDLPPPKRGTTSEKTRRGAERAYEAGHSGGSHKKNPKRSRATLRALRREGSAAVTPSALARQAREQARKKSPAERSATARKAARTRKQHAS